jgi:predicted amidophosphoribosyltransferase
MTSLQSPPTDFPASTTPWRDALAAVVALFLPVVCVGCGAPDRALCRVCRAALDARPGRTRLVAGVRLDAAFEYEGLVRTLVLEWKLRARVDVAAPLTLRTGALVRTALAATPGVVVVRVPPSRRGTRRRGFDPVVSVLRRAGIARAPALRRVRPGNPVGPPGGPGGGGAVGTGAPSGGGQKERTALERVAATVGTLSAAPLQERVVGRDVVLVDDVVTTGVTMAEAVRAVRAVGGRVVRCVAVASVEV